MVVEERDQQQQHQQQKNAPNTYSIVIWTANEWMTSLNMLIMRFLIHADSHTAPATIKLSHTHTHMHHSAISSSPIGWIQRIHSCASVHPNLCGVWNSLASNQKGLMTDFRFGYCTAHDTSTLYASMLWFVYSMVLHTAFVSVGTGRLCARIRESGRDRKAEPIKSKTHLPQSQSKWAINAFLITFRIV